MDGLIVLFIVIGIINALGSSKRKKRRAREAERRAFRESRQVDRPAPPVQRAQVRHIRTNEELQAHLAEMEAARRSEAAGANSDAAARMRSPVPAEPRVAVSRSDEPKPAEPRVAVPHAPLDGEGLHSTQGESAEEHAEHLRRAAAEETANRLAREALRDLRSARRERLQSAVVMSEILNKPVSLRPRAGLHR